MFAFSFEVFGAIFAALILSFFGTPVLMRLASAMGTVRFPGGRHWHLQPTPLWGGGAVLFGVALVIFFHPTLEITAPIAALFFGLLLFFVAGFLDDRFGLRWTILLAVQIISAAFLLFGGVRLWYVNGLFGGAVRLDQFRISLPSALCFGDSCVLPVIGSLLVILWVLAVMNAFNWLDGSDGVAASVAALAFSVLMVLSLRPDVFQPPVAIMAAAGLGSVLGFLPWNISRAKIFLGSSGSFGLGFLLAALAVLAGAKLATVALVLLLPAADALSVLVVRAVYRSPLAQADTRHLHHLLSSRGWSPKRILALHMGASAIFAAFALFLPRPWKVLFLVFGFTVLVLFLCVIKLRIFPKNFPRAAEPLS